MGVRVWPGCSGWVKGLKDKVKTKPLDAQEEDSQIDTLAELQKVLAPRQPNFLILDRRQPSLEAALTPHRETGHRGLERGL